MTTKRHLVGSVAFVGAGPGDPGLLTVRAVEVLSDAHTVVIEDPRHRELLVHTCGRRGPRWRHRRRRVPHCRRTRRLTLNAAKSGRRVVRLLEGDPFVHPTGADEALACAKAGVPFEIVPGVCGATAIPARRGSAYCGRRRSVQVVDVTSKVDWRTGVADTLVLTRLDGQLEHVVAGLIGAGVLPDTAIAVIAGGGTVSQQTVVSTLEQVVADVRAAKLVPPLLAVVGDVVDHRDALSWFETKPLFGWRVLVPRTRQQAGSLSAALRSGAIPEEVPTISVEPHATRSRSTRRSGAWSRADTNGSPSPR